MPETSIPEAVQTRPRTSLARVAVIGILIGLIAAIVGEIGRMFVDRNRHEVVPGRVYRSGQLNPDQLERFVRDHNIKTVVNLRGRPANDWYPLQSQATQALGISQEDVTTSANRLPPTGEIRRLVEVLDQSEYPILLHCQQGADRTGLAAAAYMLLHTDASYATARHQCSPRYGHFPVHTTVAMDEFFDMYEKWLDERGVDHSPTRFRNWATREYCPGPGRARLEWRTAPNAVETGKPVVFAMRAYNTSKESWEFRAGSDAGIHAKYVVIAIADNVLVHLGKAGFMDRTVPPGGYIDLELPMPSMPAPGRYLVWVDLADRRASFVQYGSEPLTHDWEARDPAPIRGR